MIQKETHDLAVAKVPKGDLLPLLDPKAAQEAYQAYLELCQAILVPYDKRIVKDGVVIQESDYARIPVRRQVGGRWITEYVDAPKKSAWRKLARFYGVSTEILEKSKEIHEDGGYAWHYTVRAFTGGVSTAGEGSCTSTEKGGRSEHETRATAHTRAMSRAISDLIGFGQVAAEEYGSYEEEPKHVEATAKVVEPEPKPEPKPEKLTKPKPQAEEPIVDSAEDTVRATLMANDVDTKHLIITRYGDVVRVMVQEGYNEMGWVDDHQAITRLLKGVWMPESERWEIPAKNLEHLGTTPPDEAPPIDIWAAEWRLKDGEAAPRDASWAWAYAYEGGDPIPRIKSLVQYVDQYGSYEAEGYTVTLGGRDRSLLNLRRNKEAKK